ncbi:MAG: hypothetical protein K0R05_2189 [Anaerocolumna sp.]|nr:hypothetical protein [Anaerocolumna sp.]
MENVRLTIEGLQFNETQDRVKNQLEGIVGVRKINYDEQTSAQEINNHLQNNGYKVSDIAHWNSLE